MSNHRALQTSKVPHAVQKFCVRPTGAWLVDMGGGEVHEVDAPDTGWVSAEDVIRGHGVNPDKLYDSQADAEAAMSKIVMDVTGLMPVLTVIPRILGIRTKTAA